MSQWHREHPEMIGTDADPWMRNASYRDAVRDIERDCTECGRYGRVNDEWLCSRCARDAES